ncbi:response regulator [Phaeocystidibacter marisrubri]|uniref:Response regulator transcription factor n=1 Tax=Phaeocystidibacter marisrubri TaxID=1577780 RepID=A0A6L3ZGM0_9FLAO|nr:response regulator transcription factor [Phaeocystidibacter marisrubri]KAB2816484.1 response regulator transcription factor [Phaeocystidibacter marisrubri]GGH69276.1 DNA-binding response regulator [Phaeocystidibacter marisrubri]
MKPFKLSIVDDHPPIIDGLISVLEDHEDIQILQTANSGESMLSALVGEQPDVIILDYSLGKGGLMNGLETAREIKRRYPEIVILMLTMHDNAEHIVSCVEAGVEGYMLKSESSFDIYAALVELRTRGSYFSPSIASQLVRNIRNLQEDKIVLTERERDVLESLFVGMSTKEIAEKLCISHNTVETHRKNLLSKFEAKNSLHLIYLALEKGMLRLK